jgi:protease II
MRCASRRSSCVSPGLHRARNDEYAWLKAENWREVMRDPSQLDPAIRAYLQAERCAMNQRACHLNAG